MFDRADNLSLVHGFTDRAGGVSSGRYATLNMGGKWGDDPDNVRTNRVRVAEAAGYDDRSLRLVRQVHGAAVARARDAAADTEADAVWCHRDDGPTVVAVLTADCVPVLLADRAGRVACAVHGGWRGVVAGVVAAAVADLERAGVGPDQLEAAIGPCIEQAAFEVGPEVAANFDPAFVATEGFARPHVDLVAAVRSQLQVAGLSPEAITRVGACTHANPDRYFSYRRDGGGIGQMLSFIGFADR